MVELGWKKIALHQRQLVCDNIIESFDLHQAVEVALHPRRFVDLEGTLTLVQHIVPSFLNIIELHLSHRLLSKDLFVMIFLLELLVGHLNEKVVVDFVGSALELARDLDVYICIFVIFTVFGVRVLGRLACGRVVGTRVGLFF
jgi:hypothetical protein